MAERILVQYYNNIVHQSPDDKVIYNFGLKLEIFNSERILILKFEIFVSVMVIFMIGTTFEYNMVVQENCLNILYHNITLYILLL